MNRKKTGDNAPHRSSERQPRKKINQGRRRKKKVFKQGRRDNVDFILFASCTNISTTRSNLSELVSQQQIIFFALWIDILRELLPSSLLEEFSGKENEYLWICIGFYRNRIES
uniref:hypothetical protein n=1 Tax=Okeania sp. SIO2F4 TaxID=2607790 RepID=UPI0025D51147|nr:hypothetical protein [Okeania sp. SIO2F4]